MTLGVSGKPPTKVQPVTAAGVADAANAKSRPTTRAPSAVMITFGDEPRTLLPIATGAVVIVDTGPWAAGRAPCEGDLRFALVRFFLVGFMTLTMVFNFLFVFFRAVFCFRDM